MRILVLAALFVCGSAQAKIVNVKVSDVTYKSENFAYQNGLFQLMNTGVSAGVNRWSIFVILNSTQVAGHVCGVTITSGDRSEVTDLFRLFTDKDVNLLVYVPALFGAGQVCQYQVNLLNSSLTIQPAL